MHKPKSGATTGGSREGAKKIKSLSQQQLAPLLLRRHLTHGDGGAEKQRVQQSRAAGEGWRKP